MARVFTITEGLENLGALKTGGQGSVYKGKRMGEIFTAIKLLPTPILSEDENDKSYRDFINEVEKLKKVNEEPNPHVVTILGSGITETGGFPFIEMEFIEGHDLGEILKPPHEKIFTLQEVIKVCKHLADALAHCHSCDVKHGDIKSNNVKFNKRTGNYMLLDFGLAILSDEDRRTSLRHAGAIEFMAPEQNHGHVFFETDVYSFGVIIFELLAGQVPFPLEDSGETARNAVMISHLETPPPDLLKLREQHMPDDWSEEKRAIEMQVPEWLVEMVYRCLEKKPEDRFRSGQELYEFVMLNSTFSVKKQHVVQAGAEQQQDVINKLLVEKEELQQLLLKYQRTAEINEEKISNLMEIISHHQADATTSAGAVSLTRRNKRVSPLLLYSLIGMVVVLAAFVFITLLGNSKVQNASFTNDIENTDSASYTAENQTSGSGEMTANLSSAENKQEQVTASEDDIVESDPPGTETNEVADSTSGGSTSAPAEQEKNTGTSDNKAEDAAPSKNESGNVVQYKVKSKAYFHNEPNASTRREAFIIHWNNATLTPLREQNGFVYVVFTNHLGQTSKGWLKKSDLTAVND